VDDQQKAYTTNFNHTIQYIDSYTSNIDVKTNDYHKNTVHDLKINSNKRIITTNESDKKVTLKNNVIVKVRYSDHLHNNFIKSKEFYYSNDALVCIKVNNIVPNKLNQPDLYKRTIYVEGNKAILDSNEQDSELSSNELVSLGVELLKEEYLSLR